MTTQDRSALRTWDATVDRLIRAGELVVRKVRSDTMIEGRSHERYDQYHQGVRVFGGDITRQVAGGTTESIFRHAAHDHRCADSREAVRGRSA